MPVDNQNTKTLTTFINKTSAQAREMLNKINA
jgi:hypothetical protein